MLPWFGFWNTINYIIEQRKTFFSKRPSENSSLNVGNRKFVINAKKNMEIALANLENGLNDFRIKK